METRVDLPAPLRPTRACVWPGSTVIRASCSATVEPNRLVMPVASATGEAPFISRRHLTPRSLPCTAFLFWSVASAEVVAPQRGVSALQAGDPAVRPAVRGHQRRGELVFEQAGAHLDDGAVMVSRARLESLAGNRGLDVVERVFGIEVGGLGDGGVDLAGRDVLQLLRN